MNHIKGKLIHIFLILTCLTHCKMDKSKDFQETYTLGIWTVKTGNHLPIGQVKIFQVPVRLICCRIRRIP